MTEEKHDYEAALREVERAISLFQEIIQALSNFPLNEKAMELKKDTIQQLTDLMESKEALIMAIKRDE